jgi:hypothetical protein
MNVDRPRCHVLPLCGVGWGTRLPKPVVSDQPAEADGSPDASVWGGLTAGGLGQEAEMARTSREQLKTGMQKLYLQVRVKIMGSIITRTD